MARERQHYLGEAADNVVTRLSEAMVALKCATVSDAERAEALLKAIAVGFAGAAQAEQVSTITPAEVRTQLDSTQYLLQYASRVVEGCIKLDQKLYPDYSSISRGDSNPFCERTWGEA